MGHALVALAYADSVPDWRTDPKTIDAIVLRIGQVGENASAAHLSAEGRAAVPDVPWPQVRLMRNQLYRRYGEIDLDIVAETLEIDLPNLVAKVGAALAASAEPADG
jgi:uncharacterized protein with HEPN domain